MVSRIRTATFLAFVAVQGLFPLWALVGEDHVTRTDFTWDMFAVRRDCSYCQIDYAIGDESPRRISWGLRSPALRLVGDPEPPVRLFQAPDIDSAGIAALEEFELLGRGILLAHPQQPALNVRAAPQVARLKTRRRLTRIGGELCFELESLYTEALAGADVPGWARSDAQRWEQSGRRLSVTAECTCVYNAGEPIDLVDPSRNLCRGGGE